MAVRAAMVLMSAERVGRSCALWSFKRAAARAESERGAQQPFLCPAELDEVLTPSQLASWFALLPDTVPLPSTFRS